MQVEDITAHGAVGNNSVLDTAGLQSAYNAAALGCGVVYIPPGRFEITKLDATLRDSVTMFGNGSRSVLSVAGFDAQRNWIDLTGSCGVTFRDFKVLDAPNVLPKVLFFVCGANSNPSKTITGIAFERISVDARASSELLFVYNVSYNNGSRMTGPGGLTIRDSIFIQRYNGTFNALSYARTSVARFDGINSRNFQSAYLPVSTVHGGNTGIVLDNAHFIDYPLGTGNGAVSKNAAFVAVTSGLAVVNGGSFQSTGESVAIFYTNNEGWTFNSPIFKASDGSGNTVLDWLLFGGGSNGQFVFNVPFFSVPRRAFFAFDPPWGGVGGLHHSSIVKPDVGANPYDCYFTLTTFSATTPFGYWFRDVDFDLADGANKMQGCGHISGILRNMPGAVALPAGAFDWSTHL